MGHLRVTRIAPRSDAYLVGIDGQDQDDHSPAWRPCGFRAGADELSRRRNRLQRQFATSGAKTPMPQDSPPSSSVTGLLEAIAPSFGAAAHREHVLVPRARLRSAAARASRRWCRLITEGAPTNRRREELGWSSLSLAFSGRGQGLRCTSLPQVCALEPVRHDRAVA